VPLHSDLPLPSILFVCLGNICRSPLADAFYNMLITQKGYKGVVASAGTGSWHIGLAPDPRAQAVALRHGLDISSLRARQVETNDFHRFDYIIAMDRQNILDLEKIAPDQTKKHIHLLTDFHDGRDKTLQEIPDPYYGTDNDFELCFQSIRQCCYGLLQALLARK